MKKFSYDSIVCIFFVIFTKNADSESLEIKARIIGDDSYAGSIHYLWQVLIRRPNDEICMGSLISLDWVLTAAKCVYQEDSVELSLGIPEMNNPDVVKRTASSIRVHPDYDSETNENDIALLKLSEAVEMGTYIKPVRFATNNSLDYTDKWVALPGYGVTNRVGKEYSERLKHVEARSLTNVNCTEMYKDVKIFDTMLCVISHEDYEAFVCHGDEGSPGTVADSGYLQVGIFSFSNKNCTDPMVLTRITSFSDWIYETMNEPEPESETTTLKAETITESAVDDDEEKMPDACMKPLFPPDYKAVEPTVASGANTKTTETFGIF